MVLELCSDSLCNVLHNSKLQLGEKKIVDMCIQIASALDYLHSQTPAVVHRDVKSHNVLVTDHFEMKLCDFGLVSTKVATAGTPAYMAPELLRSGLFSRKVDIFAFAVLSWEMFSRSIPFASWDAQEIRTYILDGKRLKLPHSGYPKQCGKLIDRCWDEDPDRRPEFSAIVRALKRIHGTLRETSHVQETDCDSFDQLCTVTRN